MRRWSSLFSSVVYEEQNTQSSNSRETSNGERPPTRKGSSTCIRMSGQMPLTSPMIMAACRRALSFVRSTKRSKRWESWITYQFLLVISSQMFHFGFSWDSPTNQFGQFVKSSRGLLNLILGEKRSGSYILCLQKLSENSLIKVWFNVSRYVSGRWDRWTHINRCDGSFQINFVAFLVIWGDVWQEEKDEWIK